MTKPRSHTPETQAPEQFDLGPFLLLFIIAAILLLIGLYLWGSGLTDSSPNTSSTTPVERPSRAENREPEATRANADTDALNVLSNSDQLEAIEADLAGTNLESLGQELPAIAAELEAALGTTAQ